MRFIIGFLLLLILPLHAEPQAILKWYLTDWPPAFILTGPHKGKGYADQLIDVLGREMPGFKHERVVLPYQRILKYLETGEQGCYPTNIYDKKHNYGIVSAPVILAAGHNIYIHKSNKDKFPFNESISLAEILKNNSLRLGIRSDLEFGPVLSPLLKGAKDQKNIMLRKGADLVDGLVKMLERGRIDYFIEYHFVMKFVTDKIGVNMSDFIEIPILENKDEFIRGAVECPDTQWGQDIIAQINAILLRVKKTEEFKELNKKWFVSLSQKSRYWEYYQKLVLDVSE